jgi:hypothetical protein
VIRSVSDGDRMEQTETSDGCFGSSLGHVHVPEFSVKDLGWTEATGATPRIRAGKG